MDIIGYENYLIYDDGRVYSKYKNRFLNPYQHNTKYLSAYLYNDKKKKSFSIHRLVALHYIPNPENKSQVDHEDRDRSNNNVNNLRWVTPLENQQNLGEYKTNSSGVKNISYHKKRNDWRYTKNINKIKHDKFFKTFEEAVEYKKEYELRLC